MSIIIPPKTIDEDPPLRLTDLDGTEATGRINGCGITPFRYVSLIIEEGQPGEGKPVYYLKKKAASGHKLGFGRFRFTIKWNGERLIATKLFPCNPDLPPQ